MKYVSNAPINVSVEGISTEPFSAASPLKAFSVIALV